MPQRAGATKRESGWVVRRLKAGLELQTASRLKEAEALYREVIAHDPGNADAWHLLGTVFHAGGQPGLAVAHIARAIQVRPDIATFHNNLGNALLDSGKPEHARMCFEHALWLDPRYAEAHVNLGNALQALGKPEEAVFCYVKAIELIPGLAEAHNNLGNALASLGRDEEGILCLREALRLKPDYAAAYVNLARLLRAAKRHEEAAACCQEAIRRKPDLAEAYGCLGVVLLDLERHGEGEACLREALRRKPGSPEMLVTLAVTLVGRKRAREGAECCRQALAVRPGFAEAHNNLATALEELGQLEEAASCYRRAIELKPAMADAHYNLANTLRRELKMSEACCEYDEAVRLQPGHEKAHWNRALTWLLMADFERGWEEFEWRWKTKVSRPRELGRPLWDGGPLEGRTILLYAEQGLGDTIQFARYATSMKESGAKVVIECQRPLVALLEGAFGRGSVVAAGDPLPDFDVQAPLMSLPRIFRTRLETIPAEVPYLAVAAEYKEKWKRRLRTGPSLRVGLAWAGNQEHAGDRQRSMTLDEFAPLAGLAGVEFYSLQYGRAACQAASPPEGLRLVDISGIAGEFRDAAAAVDNLDLVITVDTAMAHLAGALGRPVWTLLGYVPDWRWMLDREDSPWYPTMRLFRQRWPGGWREVMERVREALRGEVEGAARRERSNSHSSGRYGE